MRHYAPKMKTITTYTKKIKHHLDNKSFADCNEEARDQILQDLRKAKDLCYDLGEQVFQNQGWKIPDELEDLFYQLQEKGVIDSDLVDQMIAMYRLRQNLIIEKIEENDLALVDEIIRQDLADIDLYLREIREYFVTKDKINPQRPEVEKESLDN